MFRYPGYRLQPYIGVGPALYFARLKGSDAPEDSRPPAIGLNAELGARYYITRSWALVGEMSITAHIRLYSNDDNDVADPWISRTTVRY